MACALGGSTVPLYEFECTTCGPFDVWRLMRESSIPTQCPQCHSTARRVLTPPNLVRTPPAIRKARSLEEKSAHEPDVVVRQAGGQGGSAARKPIVSRHPWAVVDRH
jgi:putative FmdB family regulatory protein